MARLYRSIRFASAAMTASSVTTSGAGLGDPASGSGPANASEERQPVAASSRGRVVAEANSMRRLGRRSGTPASYHGGSPGSGPSYPRDRPAADRLGANPAGRGRGGRDASWFASRAVRRREQDRGRHPARRRRRRNGPGVRPGDRRWSSQAAKGGGGQRPGRESG